MIPFDMYVIPAARAFQTVVKGSGRTVGHSDSNCCQRGSGRTVGHSEVVLLTAEEQAVCSGRLKRKRDTFLPLLEHAIAYLHEFHMRFNVGVQFL